MTDFTFIVTVTAATPAQADQVVAERLGCDEDYGFPYTVDYVNGPVGESTPPKEHAEEACEEFEGDGDYCTTCGWHEAAHDDLVPCCAPWCRADLDHDGPC